MRHCLKKKPKKNCFYLTDEECKSGKGDVRILHEHVFI